MVDHKWHAPLGNGWYLRHLVLIIPFFSFSVDAVCCYWVPVACVKGSVFDTTASPMVSGKTARRYQIRVNKENVPQVDTWTRASALRHRVSARDASTRPQAPATSSGRP
ncbi:hypothetical protein IWX49DRAFT_582550 [Phyllosticta citricarpa]|uniref:Secreted protein n=2 Tax=Phyllosticta TaxID=121621 RepID=A0ABR1LEN3_9PEZI